MRYSNDLEALFCDFGLNQSIMVYLISKKRTFIPDRSVHSGDWNENKYINYSVICRSGFYHQSISRNSLPVFSYT
jgi:hypothetical protein